MNRILTTIAIAASLTMAAPAMAGSSHKFQSTAEANISTPVKVEVVIGEDLAYRANNRSKDISDINDRRLSAAFSNRSYYGDRDLERLAERLEKKTLMRLEKYGVAVDPNATTTVRLVITDADPNRPTFEQLGRDVSLSYQSFGVGGAEFEGEILSGDAVVAEFSYGWKETDIRDAQYGGTWSDANRAIDRFAKKTAKMIAGSSAPRS